MPKILTQLVVKNCLTWTALYRLIVRAAVGMGIPMGIPMGMGMVWVWGL